MTAKVNTFRDELRTLSTEYWRFFAAAFAFDLGVGLFLFLLSLYLVAKGFNEQALGNFMAALTVGSLLATAPAAWVARRYGLHRLLMIAFVCTPVIAAARLFLLGPHFQMALAFAQGAALCAWPICFAPVVASLTTERNRSAGFSIIFATGIGMGTVAGLAGGWLPGLLISHGMASSRSNAMRIVLLLACAVVAVGTWPLARLRIDGLAHRASDKVRLLHPFLIRFLPPFLLWNIVSGSFPIFGAIYLQRSLGLGLSTVGTVFSLAQLAQCAAVLTSPLLYRCIGLTRGIAAAQMVSAMCLVLMGRAGLSYVAVACYVLYTAFQFMCGPGIYNLLMDGVPEAERSTASAVQNASGAVCQAASAAITGVAIVHSGYGAVLIGNAVVGVCAAALFLGLRVSRRERRDQRETPALMEGAR